MRFVYFKRIAAIFAAMLCTCQTGSAANGCLPFANCLPDQMYHPVTRLPDGRFVNDKHDDAVVVSKMLVNRDGWATGRAGEPGVSPNWRQVEFYKAFLEFREEGHAFTDDRNVSIQSEAILAKLESLKSTGRPVYVVTFIHGWHHNADDRLTDPKDRASSTIDAVKFDDFVARYTEMTRRLYEGNGAKQTPVVFGIYVGWRGELMNGWFTVPTIGNRAKAADRIAGHRDENSLRKLLLGIADKMRDTNEDSRMLVFGHSLGGRLLSMAFLGEIAKGSTYPLGKGVLLAAVEPAISADCFDSIFAGPRRVPRLAQPGFVAVTSKMTRLCRITIRWRKPVSILSSRVRWKSSRAFKDNWRLRPVSD